VSWIEVELVGWAGEFGFVDGASNNGFWWGSRCVDRLALVGFKRA